MVITRERDASRIVSSIARWIAGLKPAFGSKFYFEKYGVSKCIKSKLSSFKGRKFCPFCNKEFKRISSFIAHLIRVHTKDIENLVIKCNNEICREKRVSSRRTISITLKSAIKKAL
ncbi:MAG: hypothetical protein DRO15_02285 [Thermoprotei archaeon]|nr:MAG: hypothetical protein DRO15_02285 [Thermoprotei archaeon]